MLNQWKIYHVYEQKVEKILGKGTRYSISVGFAAAIMTSLVGFAIAISITDILFIWMIPSVMFVVSLVITYNVLKVKDIREMHGLEKKNLIRTGIEIFKERLNSEIGIESAERLQDDPSRSTFVLEARKCYSEFVEDWQNAFQKK